MTRHPRAGVVAACLCAALTCTLAAQEMRRSAGGGQPPYDVKAETTVRGEVTGSEVAEMGNREMFDVVSLTADGKVMRLMLAPGAFIASQGFKFPNGIKVEAVGVSRGMHFKGDDAMMTRQVTVGSRTLVLRDAEGRPAWEKK